MVSLRSYRNQLSLALCNYKTKMNFQKTALFVFSKCLVLGARHVWWVWLSWFCTYCDWKNGDFSYISSLTGRYKGDQKIWRLVLHTFSTLLYSILIRNWLESFPPTPYYHLKGQKIELRPFFFKLHPSLTILTGSYHTNYEMNIISGYWIITINLFCVWQWITWIIKWAWFWV